MKNHAKSRFIINQIFQIDGTNWSMIGRSGIELLTPETTWVQPAIESIKGLREFECGYDVTTTELLSSTLVLKSGAGESFPAIANVLPCVDKDSATATYGLREIRMPFTGGLLLGNPAGHVRVPHSFTNVRELVFEEGALRHDIDHSSLFAKIGKIVEDGAEKLSHRYFWSLPSEDTEASELVHCDISGYAWAMYRRGFLPIVDDYKIWALFAFQERVLARETPPYALSDVELDRSRFGMAPRCKPTLQ